MSDRLSEEVPSESAPAWDAVRRVREPVAWALLVITAVAVLVSAWQLLGLPRAGLPSPPVPAVRTVVGTPGGPAVPAPSAVPVTTFAFRASVVAPQFVAGAVFTLPVLSVILVAFAGGMTYRARQVVQSAVAVQAVALGLGLLSWLAALGGHVRPGTWFIFYAIELAAVGTALVFIIAVLRSRALRPETPLLIDDSEDGEDFGESDVGRGDDA